MGVEGLDGFQAPGLPALALGLRPGDGLPIGGKDQAGPSIGQFHPVSSGFPDIKEKGSLNGMFVGAGFDMDAVFQKDVGGAQNVFAGVGGIGHMMQPGVAAAMFFGAG